MALRTHTATDSVAVLGVRKGHIQEEIAAALLFFKYATTTTGLTIYTFVDQPAYHDLVLCARRVRNFNHVDFYMFNEYDISDFETNITSSVLSASEIIAKSEKACFRDFEIEASDAYFVCSSIKMLPYAVDRLRIINECIMVDALLPEHVHKGKAYYEKELLTAAIAAEHSIVYRVPVKVGEVYHTCKIAFTDVGCTCGINAAHAALRAAHPTVVMTAVHYCRKSPMTPDALLDKWSVRCFSEETIEPVNSFMRHNLGCGERFGGTTNGMPGISSSDATYQAGGTGASTFGAFSVKRNLVQP